MKRLGLLVRIQHPVDARQADVESHGDLRGESPWPFNSRTLDGRQDKTGWGSPMFRLA
jgi:hypothetical protein